MQKRSWIAAVAMSAALITGGTVAMAQDGTGGPDMATPDASMCDRELLSDATISEYIEATPGVFGGQLETVPSESISQYTVVDEPTYQNVTDFLTAYESCIAKFGAAGAYAFLQPEISDIELLYLGVFNIDQGSTVSDATPEGFAPEVQVVDFTPQLIVELPDGRLGAVVNAPQPGTDLALITLVDVDGIWYIEAIAPMVDANAPIDGSSGGGP